MPYFATTELGTLLQDADGSVEYTVSADGTLLFALSDLALVAQHDEHVLLARVARAIDSQIESMLGDAVVTEPWIRADREVWELQRWQPFVKWGSSFPGHLYPGERRWVRRDRSRSTQSGFSTRGWRLDPSVVTADGWAYALVPGCTLPIQDQTWRVAQ